MNPHFHVVVLSGSAPLMQSVYAEYFESITSLHDLVHNIWKEVPNVHDMTVRRLVEETDNGDSGPLVIGTSMYSLVWHACVECDPSFLN